MATTTTMNHTTTTTKTTTTTMNTAIITMNADTTTTHTTHHHSHYPPPLTLPTTTHTTHHHHAQANDVNPDLARQACCGLANLAEMMENQNIIMRNGGCKLLIKALDNPSVLVRREASR